MSTWQLFCPDRIYEVSDELESFFFVVLYEGIHWVVHNKPDALDVKHIFDDVQFQANGRQIGGSGKNHLYTWKGDVILQQLEFTKSPPFTDLIRGLFRLFQSLAFVNCYKQSGRDLWPPDVADVDKLKNCRTIIQLMKDAVDREDWPEAHDKVVNDNYPQEEIDKEDRIGFANLKLRCAPLPAPTGTSRTSKRGREEDDGRTAPTKRFKVGTV